MLLGEKLKVDVDLGVVVLGEENRDTGDEDAGGRGEV